MATTKQATKQIFRQSEVCELLGISRACLWTWRRAGVFPEPLRLGPRLLGWRVSDVQDWIDSR